MAISVYGAGYAPSMNYPGSSGYGVNAAGQYGYTGNKAPRVDLANDYGVIDPATGKVVSVLTGKPWTGPAGGAQYSGGVIAPANKAGVPVPYSNEVINPNDPSQRYKAVDITKQPDVASAESDMMKTFKGQTDAALQDFSKYLADAKGQASTALTATQKATDIAPVAADITAAQRQYSAGLNEDVNQLTDVNAATTAAEEGVVKQAQDLLPSYDAAMNDANALAQADVVNAVSRYGAGKNARAGGVPLGVGGDVARIAANESYRASLPYEQAKIGRRYDLLQNLNLPVAQDVGRRLTTQVAQVQPQIQAAQFQTAQGTAQAVQSLKQAAAAQDWQTVTQLMQIPQMANAIRQAILSGDTSLLGMLSQLENQSHYTGLQDVLGVNLSQPQSYAPNLPDTPNYRPRIPTQPPGQSPGIPNYGPQGPGSANPLGIGGGGGHPIDPVTGGPVPGMGGGSYTPRWAPNGSIYDPSTQRWTYPTPVNPADWVADPASGGYWNAQTGDFSMNPPLSQ